MHEASIIDENVPSLSPQTFKKYLYNLYLSPQEFHRFEEINEVFSNPPFSYGTISFSKEAGGKLQLMIKEGDFRLPIKHLGSGVLQSLYIITAIICSQSKIVGIEELEQNLSPKKQYEILKKIQSMILDNKRALKPINYFLSLCCICKAKTWNYLLFSERGWQNKNKKHYQKNCKSSKRRKRGQRRAIKQGTYRTFSSNNPQWSEEDMYNYMIEQHDFVPSTKPSTGKK